MKTANLVLIASLILLVSCGKQKAQPTLTKEETQLNEKIKFNPAVLLKLREYTSVPVKQLLTTTYAYDKTTKQEQVTHNRNNAVVFGLPKEEADEIASEISGYLKERGYIIFKRHDGFNMEADSLAILKTTDQFEIPRIMFTSAPNYDLDNKTIIAKLKKWHATSPFVIVGANEAWIDTRFTKQPADMDAFAKEVYEFCPDVVDQGTGDVDALAKEMKESNTLYLWWD